jgi:hypothetical protein
MDWMFISLGFVKHYIDDIIIFSLTWRDHIHPLEEVFRRFKEHNFKLHPNKYHFFHTEMEYLGHMICPSGLKVQKTKGWSDLTSSPPTYVS